MQAVLDSLPAAGCHRADDPGASPPRLTPHDRLSFLPCRTDARQHELASHRGVAQRLAALLDCAFHGLQGDARDDAVADLGYVVPNDTLTSPAEARRLGIHGEADFFGGLVPHPFVATKVITHGLWRPGAAAPEGWSDAFPQRVAGSVLPGFSTFAREDARAAGLALLAGGAVRLKLACGIGGTGQWVLRDAAALQARLDALDDAVIARGVVLERNLEREVRTFSVGRLRLGTLVASYAGTQRNTLDRHGQEVYGGSTITMALGDLERLQQLAADAGDDALAQAVALARTYHQAACDCFEGFLASRANYDVVQGLAGDGTPLAGVLEQSWRIGGASGAEVAALQALCADPSRTLARASTVEDHDPAATVPEGAVLYFRGDDPQAGPLTKYALLHDEPPHP